MRRFVLLPILLSALALPAASVAAPYEPNDTFQQANGPLVGGSDYTAVNETDNDLDYYYFNTVGQRQLEIAVTGITGCGLGPNGDFELLDSDGRQLNSADIRSSTSSNNTRTILYTAPSAQQFVLRTDAGVPTGCEYRFSINPKEAVTAASPGVSVALKPSEEADDVQRISVNGQAVASVQGEKAQTIDLGQLPADARIGFDADNQSGRWSWSFAITNFVGRERRNVLAETNEGGSSSTPRVGVVRHIVLQASGSILESCGEVGAPTTCIPVDGDLDGVPLPQDCDDTTASVKPGNTEVPDNSTDENCDGVVARYIRGTTTTTISRKGARYRGRVSSNVTGCAAGRTVVLRRSGAGTRSFGRTATDSTGAFRFNRKRRLRGRLYVVVTAGGSGLTICKSVQSRRIRG